MLSSAGAVVTVSRVWARLDACDRRLAGDGPDSVAGGGRRGV